MIPGEVTVNINTIVFRNQDKMASINRKDEEIKLAKASSEESEAADENKKDARSQPYDNADDGRRKKHSANKWKIEDLNEEDKKRLTRVTFFQPWSDWWCRKIYDKVFEQKAPQISTKDIPYSDHEFTD